MRLYDPVAVDPAPWYERGPWPSQQSVRFEMFERDDECCWADDGAGTCRRHGEGRLGLCPAHEAALRGPR